MAEGVTEEHREQPAAKAGNKEPAKTEKKVLPVIQPFDEAEFRDPDVRYRPLRMIHDNLHTGKIKQLKDMGYGGMVTNVAYQGYLKTEEYWEILKQNIQYAVDQLGLRVWIYDERGYPSGTAGGLVLKERPDLEAQGLAVIVKAASGGKRLEITHPKGHGSVISAKAFKGSQSSYDPGSAVDLLPFTDEAGNLSWDVPDGKWIVYYFVQKPFYEGTHAVNNWYEQRRYINLLEKEAADTFINVTHKQYYERLKEYFGKGIEAFFTDEPSLMGTYIGPSPRQPAVLDAPDTEVPLLPTLGWGNRLAEEFKQRRGYDLIPSLSFLKDGDSKEAQAVRMDYYRTLSELVEEHYFEPLENFCSESGVACSGHLLLEEDLFYQAVFEGNLFAFYKHMQIPGIDLLTAFPETAKKWAVTTAKMASSAAHYYGKDHVMSEISNAFDTEETGFDGRLGAIAVQFAFGVDHFNSYYEDDKMSLEENRLFTDYIGRIAYMLDGGKQVSHIAVYYPIEGVWAKTLPAMSMDPKDFAPEAVAISNNFRDVALNLAENQLDFDYLDTGALLESGIKDGKLVTGAGWAFDTVVIPRTSVLDADLLKKLEQLADAGVHVVMQGEPPAFIRQDKAMNPAPELLQTLLSSPAVIQVKEPQGIAGKLKPLLQADLVLDQAHPEIIYLKKQKEEGITYLIVNTAETPSALKAQFNVSAEKVRLWDPLTGKAADLPVKVKDGRSEAELKLKGRQSMLVTFEQN